MSGRVRPEPSEDHVSSIDTHTAPSSPLTTKFTEAVLDHDTPSITSPTNRQDVAERYSTVNVESEGNKYSILPSGTRYDPASAPEAISIDPHYAHASYLQDQGHPPEYYASHEHENTRFMAADAAVADPPKKKRPRWLIPLLIGVAVIAILAVVLGATLGTVLPKKDHPPSATTTTSSSTQSTTTATGTPESTAPLIETFKDTGLAATQLLDGSYHLAVYYQAPSGAIVELLFKNSTESNADFTPFAQSIILESDVATVGTPLSALSYPLMDSQTYVRQIFYIDIGGFVCQANLTGANTTWSYDTLDVGDDVGAEFSSPSLTACVDPGRSFVNIFYPISGGYGANNAYMYADGTYNVWGFSDQNWTGTDTSSQYACSAWSNDEHGLNFYSRNTSSGTITRWVSGNETTVFYEDPTNGPTVPSGTALAATNDGYDMAYMFFDLSAGVLGGVTVDEGGTYNPPLEDQVESGEWTNITGSDGVTLGPLVTSSKMAVSWFSSTNAGAYLFYQSNNSTAIQVESTNAENVHVFSNAVQAVGEPLGLVSR